mgnify:FL=1|tara:strand:- start:5638 stop:5859 length:222 start_codon:yes stop_codon:yes gene_type:complete
MKNLTKDSIRDWNKTSKQINKIVEIALKKEDVSFIIQMLDNYINVSKSLKDILEMESLDNDINLIEKQNTFTA